MQNSLAVLDLRKDKLHVWTSSNPDDIEIRIKPGREQNVAKLQMTKAPPGHLILKCTDYPSESQSEGVGTFSSSSKDRAKTMLVVPEGIDQYH